MTSEIEAAGRLRTAMQHGCYVGEPGQRERDWQLLAETNRSRSVMDTNTTYLVQNLHQGYLGNSPFFWQEGNSGYTAQVDQAKRFSDEESLAMIERDPHKWRRWKLEHVMQCLVTQCDIQPLRRLVE